RKFCAGTKFINDTEEANMRILQVGFMALSLVALLVGLPVWAGAQFWTAPLPTDKVENGVNWRSGVIQATGIGVAPPNPVSPAQGRALAITAATVLARQELLAIVEGMAIAGDFT